MDNIKTTIHHMTQGIMTIYHTNNHEDWLKVVEYSKKQAKKNNMIYHLSFRVGKIVCTEYHYPTMSGRTFDKLCWARKGLKYIKKWWLIYPNGMVVKVKP